MTGEEIYIQIGILKQINKYYKPKYYPFANQYQKEEYKRYCCKIRQQKFRYSNRIICNQRSMLCMKQKRIQHNLVQI